jgi:hypothetical protein
VRAGTNKNGKITKRRKGRRRREGIGQKNSKLAPACSSNANKSFLKILLHLSLRYKSNDAHALVSASVGARNRQELANYIKRNRKILLIN